MIRRKNRNMRQVEVKVKKHMKKKKEKGVGMKKMDVRNAGRKTTEKTLIRS